MSGNIEEAEHYYQKLYADFPDNADIISNYINILLVQEKLDEAENLISVLKEKFQNDKNVSEFEKKLNELKEKQTPVENLDKNSENSFEDDDKSNLSS